MTLPFPDDVTRFIAAHLRSIEDLQLLVAVVDEPDRWWDEESVARELRVSRTQARRSLEHLAGRNLLEIRVTGDVRYQFHPGTEALRESVAAMLIAYRAHPVDVVRAVNELRRTSLRDFADAFRITRDDR